MNSGGVAHGLGQEAIPVIVSEANVDGGPSDARLHSCMSRGVSLRFILSIIPKKTP